MSDIRPLRQLAGTAALVAVITALYYVIPVPSHPSEGSWSVIFGCGMAVQATLILLSVVRLLRAGEEQRTRALVVLLCFTVLFFSWVDVALAVIPGQFVGLHTKTDGLYFSISTLATVGFGDVHASGQLARIAVTVQIVFNLVFLGTAIAMISGLWRETARRIGSRPGHSVNGSAGSAGDRNG